MSIRKKIEMPDWQGRLQSITSGNRGRTAAIGVEGTTLVEQKALESVVYDPVDKGNEIMITLKGFAHTVDVPVEIFIEEDDDGRLTTLEIKDQNGELTFLRLL